MSAQSRNAENVIVLWNQPAIAAAYDREWQRLWREADELREAVLTPEPRSKRMDSHPKLCRNENHDLLNRGAALIARPVIVSIALIALITTCGCSTQAPVRNSHHELAGPGEFILTPEGTNIDHQETRSGEQPLKAIKSPDLGTSRQEHFAAPLLHDGIGSITIAHLLESAQDNHVVSRVTNTGS